MEANGWKMMAVAGFAALGGMVWCQVMAPRVAVGYPSGPAVSYGNNPVFSVGGSIDMYTGGTDLPGVEQPGQDMIVTDITVSSSSEGAGCLSSGYLQLKNSAGDALADIAITTPSYRWEHSFYEPVVARFASGVRIPDGDSLTIYVTSRYNHSDCSLVQGHVHYTLSGYYAEP